jgi:hypothetical protein
LVKLHFFLFFRKKEDWSGMMLNACAKVCTCIGLCFSNISLVLAGKKYYKKTQVSGVFAFLTGGSTALYTKKILE